MMKNMNTIFRFNFATLTRIEAESRAALIKQNSINYAYYLALHKGNNYDGLTNITFETNSIPNNQNKNLRIDFNGKSVKGLLVN